MDAGAFAATWPAPPRFDTMRRLLVPTCLLLGAALLAPALLSLERDSQRVAHALTALRPAAAARSAPLSDARACKPQPPVAATLEQVDGEGDVVELSFSVTPHADAGELRWSLALPPGAVLIEGPASGALPAGSAGTGPLVARLRLPAGDAQVSLDVEGALAASAGATAAGGREPLRARRALSWLAPQPVVAQAGARTPARHREGR